MTISGLTVANNIYSGGGGGGISNAATLTVSNCTISNNAAALAGGILNLGTLAVANSTFSGNNAAQGGGIHTEGAVGTVTVTNSAFTGNTATSNRGGGIDELTGFLTVSNSTISGNTAPSSGGIFNGGTLTLLNSIVAGNTTGGTLGSDDCDACGMQNSCNMIGGAPQLGSPAANGGPTQTMLPLPGSPAICAGSPVLIPAGLTTDQRGFPRINTSYTGYTPPSSPCVDADAVQTNYQSVQFTNASSGYEGIVNQPVSLPPVVSVTENGQNIGGVPITLGFSGSGNASGLGPVPTVAGSGATFNSLSVNAAGNDTLSVTLPIVGSFSITTSPTAELDIISQASQLNGSNCNGEYTGTYKGNLKVSPGQVCTFTNGGVAGNLTLAGGTLVLENNSYVNGNLQVSGGSLSISNSTVGNNLQINGGGTFSIGPAVSIGGNLQIQNLPASASTDEICGARIKGGLQFQNSGTGVLIGSASGCAGNTVGGDLQVQNNTATVTIDYNTVGGNLTDQSNSAATTVDNNTVGNNLNDLNNTAATQVFTNNITHNLQCNGNTSITGGGNTASSKQGQCATF